MFGIGRPETAAYGQTAGMGGVAYAMRGRMLLNNDNPASLTGLDSCLLVAEASGLLSAEYNRSGKQRATTWQGNFIRFAIGGRILKGWYMGGGIAPYSSVGYYFNTYEPVAGTDGTYQNSLYEGSGGLNRMYWTNALQLGRYWSVGINFSYIFGRLKQTETQDQAVWEQEMTAGKLYADFGCLYSRRISREAAFTIGLVYGYRQAVTFSNRIEMTGNAISATETRKKVKQYLPDLYGAGANLRYKKMSYALDYSFRKYSLLASSGPSVKFRDAHEWKAGLAYQPASYLSDLLRRRMEYKAGFSYSIPYMKISGCDGRAWRASLGVGFPLTNGMLGCSLFYDHTRYGSSFTGRTAGLVLTYTLGEKFFRGKLE